MGNMSILGNYIWQAMSGSLPHVVAKIQMSKIPSLKIQPFKISYFWDVLHHYDYPESWIWLRTVMLEVFKGYSIALHSFRSELQFVSRWLDLVCPHSWRDNQDCSNWGQTAKKNKLSESLQIKISCHRNGSYGFVRQWCQLFQCKQEMILFLHYSQVFSADMAPCSWFKKWESRIPTCILFKTSQNRI